LGSGKIVPVPVGIYLTRLFKEFCRTAQYRDLERGPAAVPHAAALLLFWCQNFQLQLYSYSVFRTPQFQLDCTLCVELRTKKPCYSN